MSVSTLLVNSQCFSIKSGMDKGYNYIITITDKHFKQSVKIDHTNNIKIDSIKYLESLGYEILCYAEFNSEIDILTAIFPATPYTFKPLKDAVKESKKKNNYHSITTPNFYFMLTNEQICLNFCAQFNYPTLASEIFNNLYFNEDEEILITLSDIIKNRMVGAYGNFVYCSENLEFYKNNRGEINRLINQTAKDRKKPSAKMIWEFIESYHKNKFSPDLKKEIIKGIYDCLDSEKIVGSVPNSVIDGLVWFAVEEIIKYLHSKLSIVTIKS